MKYVDLCGLYYIIEKTGNLRDQERRNLHDGTIDFGSDRSCCYREYHQHPDPLSGFSVMKQAETIPRHSGGNGEIVDQKNLETVVREVLDAMEGRSGSASSARQQDVGFYEDAVTEAAAAVIHALERVRTTGALRFDSRAVVRGSGLRAMLCIAALRSMGTGSVTALIDDAEYKELAGRMGAAQVIVRSLHEDPEALGMAVERSFDGRPADVGFQCSDSPEAHAEMYRCIRSGGVLCELGLTQSGRGAEIDPYLAFCVKEMTVIGSCGGTPQDRKAAQAFLRRAGTIGIPVEELEMIGRMTPEKQAVRKEETR